MRHIVYYVSDFTYQYNPETDAVERIEVYTRNTLPYSEENISIAKERAYNGDYTIEEQSAYAE